jgi:acyl dehydratase
MRVLNGPDELKAAAGTNLGVSDWVTVDQKQIDTFADATHDHQWIHIDAEKAAAGPFGKTIAHGFLSLSMLVPLAASVYRVDGVKMGINYGLNKVRFTNPVPVGSRIRANIDIAEVTEVGGGLQVTLKAVVELEGSEKPAVVAEWITRQFF